MLESMLAGESAVRGDSHLQRLIFDRDLERIAKKARLEATWDAYELSRLRRMSTEPN